MEANADRNLMRNGAHAKELKELIDGVLEMAVYITEELRDGVEVSDFVKIFAKMQSETYFVEAFKGVSKIPKEAKEMTIADGLDLAMIILDKVPKFIKAASKKI